MQFLIILLCIAVFCLWMRGSDEDRNHRFMMKRSKHDQDQIERLKSRIMVLEEILLDRDRKLRDGL